MNKEDLANILAEELGFVNYINVTKYIAELDTEIIILKDKLNKIKKSFDDDNLNNYYHGMSYEFEINEFKDDVLEILEGRNDNNADTD